MQRRSIPKNFGAILAVLLLCTLVIYFSNLEKLPKPPEYFEPLQHLNNCSLETMQVIIDNTLIKIKNETADIPKFKDELLFKFLPKKNGHSIKTIIVSTWRSGSTFLAEILNQFPGSYYHYEPLLQFDIIQIRGTPYMTEAQSIIKNLFECDYYHLDEYLNYGISHTNLFSHNKRLLEVCLAFPGYCYTRQFLSMFCSLFPVHILKTVRIRLKLLEGMLQTFNTKIILLVRDPRGVMQSRKHRHWCPNKPDCSDPALLCSDMVSDYVAAKELSIKYPGRIRAIRYEDFSLNPYRQVKNILSFMSLPLHKKIIQYLDSHTTENRGGVSSTYRNSTTTPFHWVKDLTMDEINRVQDLCSDAMQKWGYRKVTNKADLSGFRPLTNYTI